MTRATLLLATIVALLFGYLAYLEHPGSAGPGEDRTATAVGADDGEAGDRSRPADEPLALDIPSHLIDEYRVEEGEHLTDIALSLSVSETFLRWLNDIPRGPVEVGDRLRVVHGPFRAEVGRDRRRLAIYLGSAGTPLKTYPLGATPSLSPGRYQVRNAAEDRGDRTAIWLERPGTDRAIAIRATRGGEDEVLPARELRELSDILVAGSPVEVVQ